MSTHLPDQAVFRPTLPEDIDWEPFPAFPPSARLAVVVAIHQSPLRTWSGSSCRPASS